MNSSLYTAVLLMHVRSRFIFKRRLKLEVNLAECSELNFMIRKISLESQLVLARKVSSPVRTFLRLPSYYLQVFEKSILTAAISAASSTRRTHLSPVLSHFTLH